MFSNHTLQFGSPDLELEGSIWIGIILSAIFYGVYLGIYYLLILALFCNHTIGRISRRKNWFIVIYSSCQLVLNTFLFLSWPYLGQSMWIIHRNNSIGGPKAYFNATYGHESYVWLGVEAQNIAIFLSDALLIYRCYVIFGCNINVVPIPGLCAIGYLALGVAIFAIGMRKTEAGNELTVWMSAVQVMLTTLINVLVTGMISWRLLSLFYKGLKHAGSTTVRMYTSVVAIFIESAAPSAFLGVVVSAVNTHSEADAQLPWTFGLYITWCMVTALSPQLIIYRMAKGIAWTSTTVTEVYGLHDPELTTSEMPWTIAYNTLVRPIGPRPDTA